VSPGSPRDLAPPSALLFDLDGTLVDSRRDIAVACNATRTAHGLPPLAFEAIMAMVGDGARALVARAFDVPETEPLVDAALATFKASYLAHPCEHTALLPGVRELLAEAAADGVPCAVVTNKPRDVTLVVLERLAIAPQFRAVWGGGDGALKPAPDGLRRVLAELGVADARGAWMIGDGPQDVGAGKAAGCVTVGVPGIAERERLVASAPDLWCETLVEVAELLRGLRG
jgi:phosphoglycolate phosphatase